MSIASLLLLLLAAVSTAAPAAKPAAAGMRLSPAPVSAAVRAALPDAAIPAAAIPPAASLPSLPSAIRVPAAIVPAAPEPPTAAIRQLGAAVQAAGPEQGGEGSRHALERAFSGVWGESRPPEPAACEPPSAGPTPIERLRADAASALDYLAATPHRWRSRESLAKELARRAREMSLLGGIPRRVPAGPWTNRTELSPLSPELVALLPELAETLERIERQPGNPELWAPTKQRFLQQVSELFHGWRTLAERAETAERFEREIRWLFGTYRLGEPRR